MQSWVEIPEKYDEMWSRRATSARQNNAASIRPPALDWRAGLENLRRRRTEREAAEVLAKAQAESKTNKDQTKKNIEQNTDHIVDINERLEDKEKTLEKNNSGVMVKSIRNINLINRVLGGLAPAPGREITGENADEVDTDVNRNSVYDNVDSSKKLEVVGPTTGDESSYKSGEDFRDTTETGGGNLGSSDAAQSDNNDADNKKVPPEELKKSSNNKRRKSSSGNTKESSWKKNIPSIVLRKATKPKITVNNANHGGEIRHDNNNTNDKKNDDDQSTKPFSNVVRLAQQVNKFTNNSKKVQNRRKFNYEKYIKYLELTLDTVGFSLGKVTITWDRVSFFLVLLMSLVGVFAQNAFLK